MYLGYLEDIVSFGTRVVGSSECEAAGDYIYNEFESMGLEVRYHNWSNQWYSDSNIEATLPGTKEASDEIYIICAHHDTVFDCPGADDDGSGVAAVLSAANIMKDYSFNHTIRFVSFSGEELGLMGSQEYVAEAYANGDNIIAVLNVDMIGFATSSINGSNIRVYENVVSEWLTDFTINASEQYEEYIELNVIPSGYSTGSDHASFWEFGYDAIWYQEYEFNDYWHTYLDTIENMNITYAMKCSKLIVATLAELAQQQPPNVPTIKGPTTGIIGKEYEYTVVTTDPDGDQISYYIDWGDSTNSSWFGPYGSGDEATAKNTWTSLGDYEIRAKAKDKYDRESNWSDPHIITIVEGPKLEIGNIKGGLCKISTIIKNIGGVEATGVSWKISLAGGAFIGKETTGTEDIPAGGEITVTSKLILGLGQTTVTVTAEAPESSDTRSQGGFVFLFFIKVNLGG